MAHRGEDLYEQHARSVYRYLFSLCGEADTAEELTQETFCQALRGLDTFRGDCTPMVWLCAIAKRLWFAECRRRQRASPLEEEALNRLEALDDPAAELESREERLALYRAMQRLDPETREVIYQRLAGQFSCREIGELLAAARYGPGALLPGQGGPDAKMVGDGHGGQ
jgi:RNA polymerase sigma-70 factor (ECF subfamily)